MIDNITLDNLHIGCKASNKAEVIAMIGEEFKAKGYVNQECVHFLLEREHQVSTFRQWHHPAAFAEIRDGYHP